MAEEGGEQVSTPPVRIDDAFVNIKPDWCGLLCWRIENFTLVKWTNLGSFYTGDSYLVYHSYTVGTSKRVIQDIYFWLGAESSTDERGTAAIKAVELDDYFGGAPTQYREVQYHESERFRKLWESYGGVRFMEGGVASGFRKVEEEEGQYTLYQVKGAKNPVLQQVPCTGKSLNHGDVFILHKKGEFWIWFGKNANRMEKNKGVNALDALRSHDPKAKVNRLEGSETDPAFTQSIHRVNAIKEVCQELQLELTDLGTKTDGAFDIREVMYRDIRDCDIFIADLTGARHNVMDEVGYALQHVGTGRMVFYFQDSPNCMAVPFDVSHLSYDKIVDSAEIKIKTKARIETILEKACNGEI